jgi:DNA-binding NarL/FixJ family response regulator
VSADWQRQISVLIVAHDPISRAGVERQLVGLDDIAVLAPAAGVRPDVALVVAAAIDEEVLRWIRTIRGHSASRVVVVADATTQAIAAATDAGASAVVPRFLADRRRLLWAIQKIHRGEPLSAVAEGPARQPAPAAPPPPHETTERAPDAVSERDRQVLRLLAEGCDTGEIARSLAYSEPTIKNAIQRLFEQLHAKNRPHAVALALRAGII